MFFLVYCVIPVKLCILNPNIFLDGRVSVGHGLQEGPYELCYACRRPILEADKDNPAYEHGVSCHNCIDETDEKTKAGNRERQKQVALSMARGERHIGR